MGQYLKNDELSQPIDRSKNPWYQFLKENPDVANIPEIIQVDEKASLVQTYQRLEDSIKAVFSTLDSDFSQVCVPQRKLTVNSNDIPNHQSVVGQMEFDYGKEDRINAFMMTKTINSAFSFLFLSWNPVLSTLNGLRITGGTYLSCSYSIVTQSFYTHDVVSVLLASESTPRRLIQLPISQMEPYMANLTTSTINLQDAHILPQQSIFSLASAASHHRELEGLNAELFSLSGPRKVVAFLFKNKKKVRIYDMEIEEEEEEDNDIVGNSSELNTSY